MQPIIPIFLNIKLMVDLLVTLAINMVRDYWLPLISNSWLLYFVVVLPLVGLGIGILVRLLKNRM